MTVQKGRPFKRALAMMAAVQGLMAAFQGLELSAKLQSLGTYKSRGKGKGSGRVGRRHHTTNWKVLLSTRATGTNGPREMARRVRQMQRDSRRTYSIAERGGEFKLTMKIGKRIVGGGSFPEYWEAQEEALAFADLAI